MPTVHPDTCLESAREQLSFCRAEIILGARRLRAQAAPSVEDSHLMADAVLEYFAAVDAVDTAPAASDLEALRAYRAEKFCKHSSVVADGPNGSRCTSCNMLFPNFIPSVRR